MSTSSGEDFRVYRRTFPVHDAAEAGDMQALTRMLRPHRKSGGGSVQGLGLSALPAAAALAAAAAGADGSAAASGVAAGGEDGGRSNKATDAHAAAAATPASAEEGAGQEPDDNDDLQHEDDGYHPAVDLEERDVEGATPLHVALLAKRLGAARLLLEAGAGTTRRMEGSTAAHIALSVASVRRHRNFADAALRLLLEHHHDVAVKDDRGQTLLHLAASLGLDEVIATLLSAPGGKELLDVKERLHCRPIHLAALGGHVGATEALISAGCDTSFSNLHGNSSLHLACSKARWAVARVLLDHGKANVKARNKNGETPPDLAYKQGFHIPETLPELQPAAGEAKTNGVASSEAPNKTHSSNDSHARPMEIAPDVAARKAKWEFPEAGSWRDGSGGGGGSRGVTPCRTAVLHHPLCLQHFSCPPIRRSSDPPPENVKRLEVIYNEDSGVLRADEFASLEWENHPSRAQLADVLRVHDYTYVQKLERLCKSIPPSPMELRHLDGDTVLSHDSFEAALRAAGAVCDAVDRVMTGKNRNAFCAVRPPGHHAGPRGVVTCGNDAQGSHGFCLLNNVAIGAAYARCCHRHTGIDRVAIVDFDVHHGNGTEDIVKALVPRVEEAKVVTPFCSGVLQQVSYKPWLNPEDADKCLFVSVHGYGKKEKDSYAHAGWFYPGSGATTDCPIAGAEGPVEGEGAADAAATETGAGAAAAAAAAAAGARETEEDGPEVCSAAGREPLVLDVGMPLPEGDDTPGSSRHRWRDVYRKEILPKLAAFKPDLILVSAGFDAHKKDSINYGYIGLLEEDYEWVTQQLVQVANKCCKGRLVSVLEGGYRIQGGIVSAFGRSVAGHVRALVDGCESRQEWSAAEAARESDFEQRLLQERERKRKLRMEQQLQALRDRENQLRMAMLQEAEAASKTAAATATSAGNGNGNGNGATPGANAEGANRGENAAGADGDAHAAAAQATAAQGALPVAAAAGTGEEGASGTAAPQEEEGPLPTKRRRFNVDYVALQKKLQEEESSKTGKDGGVDAAVVATPAPPAEG